MEAQATQVVRVGRRRGVPGILAIAAIIALVITPAAQARATNPYFNNSYADRPVEPSHFSPYWIYDILDSNPFNSYVSQIQWSSWGGAEATGNGYVDLLDGSGSTSPATVTLAGRQRCAGLSVYTTYSLQLAQGAQAPRQWPRGQTGTFPCRIAVAGYEGRARRDRQCYFNGLGLEGADPDLSNPATITWQPRLPQHTWLSCYARWHHWGRSTVLGDGVENVGHRWRPAKLKLFDPVWCPAGAQTTPHLGGITYGALRLTLYGNGVNGGNGRSLIGYFSGKKRVYTERLGHLSPDSCAQGDNNDLPNNPNPVVTYTQMLWMGLSGHSAVRGGVG